MILELRGWVVDGSQGEVGGDGDDVEEEVVQRPSWDPFHCDGGQEGPRIHYVGPGEGGPGTPHVEGGSGGVGEGQHCTSPRT